MTVIARDAVASDHLVYAWPFSIGPECEVSCADDEQVVMCPGWMVGDRLGPGHHRWRTPDPSRPAGAFFVLTAPVEVPFDMVTSFLIPATGQRVRLRASGALQVRCADPGLLVAQFVGLPFDNINDGVLRSVSRSVERMLARLLTRRVVMSGTPIAVTESGMLPGIIEELIAYNPTAGAVFGVELIRLGYLVIAADDGSSQYLALPSRNLDWSGSVPKIDSNGAGHAEAPYAAQAAQVAQAAQAPQAHAAHAHNPPPVESTSGGPQYPRPKTPMLETQRGMAAVSPDMAPEPLAATSGEISKSVGPLSEVSGEIGGRRPSSPAITGSATSATASGEIGSRPKPPPPVMAADREPPTVASGEIRSKTSTPPPPSSSLPGGPTATAKMPVVAPPRSPSASGELQRSKATKVTLPPPLPPLPRPPVVERPGPDEITEPGLEAAAVMPGQPSSARRASTPAPVAPAPAAAPAPAPARPENRGSILGIGTGSIGHGVASGEIPIKVPPGGRVLVPGPNGLMQSATVRQLLEGYYELEVGSSGQTIWVPINGVVPD